MSENLHYMFSLRCAAERHSEIIFSSRPGALLRDESNQLGSGETDAERSHSQAAEQLKEVVLK